MKNITKSAILVPLLSGLIVGLIGMALTVKIGWASQSAQGTSQETVSVSDDTCKECHLDITESWSNSPHAHAFDDVNFQDRWNGLGKPGDCLLCHTTDYQATNGSYKAEGVSCSACHGEVSAEHPPAVVSIRADTDYCGTCHTTTLHEWRLTGHAAANVGCMDCHDPHSQTGLFKVADDMCINCHQDDMADYLEDLHVQKNIGCVDCHALVIPPEVPPEDGIVPTGHSFTITPETCVACHTDALHAGFSMPGYENGAAAAGNGSEEPASEVKVVSETTITEPGLTAEQELQAMKASQSSIRLATLFQGGVIGLVLGGSTAWFVARNVRRRLEEQFDEEDKSG